jgi:hypothetical protein
LSRDPSRRNVWGIAEGGDHGGSGWRLGRHVGKVGADDFHEQPGRIEVRTTVVFGTGAAPLL